MAQLRALKSIKITGKGQIAIPKELRKGKFEGEVALLVFEDRIEIRPLSDVAGILTDLGEQSMLMSQEALAKRWNDPREDKAWRDL